MSGTEQRADLRCLQAEGREVDAKVRLLACLEREQLPVPPGLLGELTLPPECPRS
jgi:hypothetical protein